MNTDAKFCFSIGINEIPWSRLVGFYGRANDYPQYFEDLFSIDMSKHRNAITQIGHNSVHQDSITMVTPFALLFLLRVLSFNYPAKTDILQIILKISKAAKFQSQIFNTGNLKIDSIKDLLSEKYIWDTFKTEHQEEINQEEFDDTDLYFYWVKYSLEIIHIFSYSLKSLTDKNEMDIVNKICAF